MSKLAVSQRVPSSYDRASIFEIVRLLELQANQHAEGAIAARHGAMASVPTAGTFIKGDIVWDSAPAVSNGTVRLGWICTASGSPGTFQEIRTMVATFGPITNSLGADVLLNNTANYFDGPSVAQGSSGTWFASGTVTLLDTSAAAAFVKLWDGTTVIASCVVGLAAGNTDIATLSGYISNPTGNIRISVRDASNTSGKIIFNGSGNSKDSTITAVRIG